MYSLLTRCFKSISIIKRGTKTYINKYINTSSWDFTQIKKMLCSGKLGLSLLLLIWCTFESTASSTERERKNIYINLNVVQFNNTLTYLPHAESYDDDADILEALLFGTPQELDNKTNGPNVDQSAKKDERK